MAKKEIHELSYDELVLYEKQLRKELAKVSFRINQYKKAGRYTDFKKDSSQTSSEEK